MEKYSQGETALTGEELALLMAEEALEAAGSAVMAAQSAIDIAKGFGAARRLAAREQEAKAAEAAD
jgi:hypothetical protein